MSVGTNYIEAATNRQKISDYAPKGRTDAKEKSFDSFMDKTASASKERKYIKKETQGTKEATPKKEDLQSQDSSQVQQPAQTSPKEDAGAVEMPADAAMLAILAVMVPAQEMPQVVPMEQATVETAAVPVLLNEQTAATPVEAAVVQTEAAETAVAMVSPKTTSGGSEKADASQTVATTAPQTAQDIPAEKTVQQNTQSQQADTKGAQTEGKKEAVVQDKASPKQEVTAQKFTVPSDKASKPQVSVETDTKEAVNTQEAPKEEIPVEVLKPLNTDRLDTVRFKVGDGVDMNASNPAKALAEKITVKAEAGIKEFEIKLFPKDLGAVTIKLVQDAGGTSVTLLCSNPKALSAMTENAAAISRLVENNTNAPVTVNVQKEEQQQLGEREGGGQQFKQQQEQSDQQNRKKESDEIDFAYSLQKGFIVKDFMDE